MTNILEETITTIETLDQAISRIDISLLALNWIKSEDNLNYYKDLKEADFHHNMETLFEEIRTIHSMIYEEIDGLREYKLDLNGRLKRLMEDAKTKDVK
nr:hypothetical protein 2 [Campylobacterota bacterium]